MIWINYLIRVPFGAVIATVMILLVIIATLLMSIFVNWQVHIIGLIGLPKEWLDITRTIGGLKGN
jgi:hypothetical protein